MSDDEERDIACLGELEDACRALAHLGQRTDGRLDGFGADGLNGINDHDLRLQLFDLLQNALQRSLGRNIKVLCVAGQPLRTQLELTNRLFARGVESLAFALLHQHLQRQRRFADAGFAAQQYQTAGHQSAA